ncbi:MAG: hypothetical protein ACOXZ0_00140 [Eubacteriales bacterium]|jgi:hypothetical protein
MEINMRNVFIKAKNKIKELYLPKLLLPAGFLTVFLSLLWTPADYSAYIGGLTKINFFIGEPVTSFNRGIGQALINGFDIFARIRNMSFYAFLYLPLIFLSVYGVICLLLRHSKDSINEEISNYINTLAWVSSAALLIQLFNRLNPSFFNYFSAIPPAMIALLIVYIRFFQKSIPFDRFKWCLLTPLALEIPVVILFYKTGFAIDGVKLSSMITFGTYTIFTITLIFIMRILVRKQRDTDFCSAFTPIIAAPIFFSTFIELTNVLNQHEIFVAHKSALSLLIFFVLAVCCVILFLWYGKRTKKVSYDISKWYYPLLILSYAMLMVQPPTQVISHTELFESSNYGSLIYGLLKYGEIPFVSNLNVHMLSDALGGVLYGWLNNDALGGLYLHYDLFTPITYLLWYLLLKRIMRADYAALFVLLFPITGLFGFSNYYALGFIVVIAALRAFENNKKRNLLLFCLACVAACLYRMDMTMFVIGSVVALSIAFIIEKRKKHLLWLWISGTTVITAGAMVFALLCMMNGISPLARIVEFVNIMMSNVNWAYTNVANYSEWYYFFIYLIIPVFLLCSVLAVFVKYSREKTNELQNVSDILPSDVLLVVILAIAFIFNFQRGIVRHNILEKYWCILLSVAPLCICISCFLIFKKKPCVLFGGLTLVLLLQLPFGAGNLSGQTLLQTSLNRQTNSDLYQVYSEKIDRVEITKELKDIYLPLKLFFDATLDKDETYFDFTVNTSLYALVNRKKPVYINQSPSQLNGEYTQLMFNYEIESSDCPFALVSSYHTGFDDVPLRINQYLVAEFLYKEYRPLCVVNGYEIWARNDCFEAKKALIESLLPAGNDIDYDIISFSEINDTTVSKKNGSLVFKNGIQDPYVDGIENNQKLQQLMMNSTHIVFCIDYESTAAGNFQCFYSSNGENYSEGQSVLIQANKGVGELIISVPCGEDTRLRFDFPAGSEFTIKGIQCMGVGDKFLSSFQWIDYTHEALPHTYNICKLAYYWGTFDKAKPQTVQRELISGVENVTSISVKLDMDDIDISQGNYIEIIANSNESGNAHLSVSSETQGSLIDFGFDIFEGTHNRYLMRISSDALWYSGLCDTLTISSDVDMSNVSIRILQGDVNFDGMSALERKALAELFIMQ